MQDVDRKTALLSVYNKSGIVDFARELRDLGWYILASGGTAETLRNAGITVRDVANLVGEPILDHRVVTLSREIHAGLLARPQDLDKLKRLGIPWIDMVCVDLYPLEDEIASESATLDSVIEKTDIGGPTLLRSAAKGRRIVIYDPDDRRKVIDILRAGTLDDRFITHLAAKAERRVAKYCQASADFLNSQLVVL